MLRYLYADELAELPELETSMFTDRADQFQARLNWDVDLDGEGAERDEYDALNPLYVIWQKPDGLHGGSMRVLPTTGPCMTNDHFADVCGRTVRHPLVWESTRFCLNRNSQSMGVNIATALMLAGCELGIRFGLERAVGVFDARMIRLYRMAGWAPVTIGSAGIGRDRVFVGLWEFTEDVRANLSRVSGIALQQSEKWFQDALEAPFAAISSPDGPGGISSDEGSVLQYKSAA